MLKCDEEVEVGRCRADVEHHVAQRGLEGLRVELLGTGTAFRNVFPLTAPVPVLFPYSGWERETL